MFEITNDNRDPIKYKALFFLVIGIMILVTGLLFWGLALFVSIGDDSKIGAARILFCGKIGSFFCSIGLIVMAICFFFLRKVKLSIQEGNNPRN